MIENINEMTEELKDSNGEESDQLTKSIRSAFWPKKPYSAEAEVKKLRKQLQEKKELIRELKKDKKDLYRRIWGQDDLIKQLKGIHERDGQDIGDVE
jgi:predicted RNase H-like nuclease (RuvC/YqgF family)